eukprot:486897-Pelagomonas_calceolata.AAC.3
MNFTSHWITLNCDWTNCTLLNALTLARPATVPYQFYLAESHQSLKCTETAIGLIAPHQVRSHWRVSQLCLANCT